ncbi:tetratricopeptide repeat protein [Puia sp. P3]|uniref:tetratricopeptide repeat protein n=1 Tax=Puia sp. P3 TaxID=3423952 RepID=UPI003D668D5E
MRSAIQLTAVIVLLAISGTAQDITQKDADSLLHEITRAIPVKDRISALLQLAAFNTHQRTATAETLAGASDYLREAAQLNRKSPFPFFNEQRLIVQSSLYKAQHNAPDGKNALATAIELLKNSPNKTLLGKAYYEMSEFYSGDFHHETMLTRIKYLQLAIAAYEKTDRLVDLARCYRFLADLHQLLNDNRSAFSEVRTALKYYDQAEYADKQGAVALLGRIYYEEGDYQHALQNELHALRIATNSSQDNVSLICQINNNIGYTYLKLNDADKALQYFQDALKIAQQEKDTSTVYLLAANVVDAYLGMNDPEKAARFFRDISRQIPQPAYMRYEGGDYGISHTWLKIYMAMGQYDKARVYCDYLIRQASNPNINLYTLTLYYQLDRQILHRDRRPRKSPLLP